MTTTTDAGPTSPAADGVDGSDADVVVVPARTHARRAWLLLLVGAFQVWLWTTRLVNLANDPEPRTTGFVVVHTVLYVAAFGAALALLALGWRQRREARAVTTDRSAATDRGAAGRGASQP